ncbi:Scr1 family TA system antitoxin-like transcriptional regulator [Kitasatospora sp. NBC_00374]|uniref:helix-turn-helix domain-containing protein n=1 Tax=Kitasatospora sp. NBC_00374 TaxID=2975964 RepID=UPI0030DE8B07
MFGSELLFAREAAGLSQHDLGARVHCTPGQISRIEGATRKPTREFAELCDRALGTGQLLARIWSRVDWDGAVGHPDWFRRYAGLEAEATIIRQFQVQLVPGLLQTPDYARTLFRAKEPLASPDRIEELVAARLDRQRILTAGDPPRLLIVLDEGVLLRNYGGEVVMRAQLAHLLSMAEASNIVLRVAPLSLGAVAAFDHSFTLLTLPDEPDVIYVDGIHRGQVVDDPVRFRDWAYAYDLLLGDSLSEGASLARIRSAMEGLRTMNSVPNLDAASWRKSTYSTGDGGNCIEVADGFEGLMPVRDSKDPDGPKLVFPAAAWRSFLAGVRAGDFPDC